MSRHTPVATALQAALAARDTYLEPFGCSNCVCVVSKPKGMCTNGGCKCTTDRMVMQRFAYANNKFADEVRAAITQATQDQGGGHE